MDQVDGKISEIERKITTNTPGTTPSRKKEVPTEVRVSIMYYQVCTHVTNANALILASFLLCFLKKMKTFIDGP